MRQVRVLVLLTFCLLFNPSEQRYTRDTKGFADTQYGKSWGRRQFIGTSLAIPNTV